MTSGATERLVEVAAVGAENVYVGWQTRVRGRGYATYLRRLAVATGWTGRSKRVSRAYGGQGIWPGDTFGLSTRSGSAILSWGSSEEIFATRATLPAHHQ